jgi:putative endonuclease
VTIQILQIIFDDIASLCFISDMKTYFVYILASKPHGTLYIGVTYDLVQRVYEHRNSIIEGFTSIYDVNRLVYFETTNDVLSAITREKQLKKWKRDWKIQLIENANPYWDDLYNSLL